MSPDTLLMYHTEVVLHSCGVERDMASNMADKTLKWNSCILSVNLDKCVCINVLIMLDWMTVT